MEKELVDKIAGILREEGFKRLTREKSSVSYTLAAERDDLHVIFHLREGAELPTSVSHSTAPKDRDIMQKATLAGLHGVPGNSDALRTLRKGGSGMASGSVRHRAKP